MKNIYKVLCLGAILLPGMIFAQKPAKYMVKKATAALTIDGVANETAWTAVAKTAIAKPFINGGVPEVVVGGSATFQMLYDLDNLYLFVDIKDDVVTLDAKNDWRGDKFEFYLGLPGYAPEQGADKDHGRQFVGCASQEWFDDATKLTHPNYYGVDLWPGQKSRATDGVTFFYKETADGYAYEFQINKSALENIDFATVDTLAFDFTLADNDVVDGDGIRNRLVYYNTGNLTYAAENWGKLDLASMGFDNATSVGVTKTSTQLAYIAQDVLKFKGYDSAVNVELYSILGNKVLSAKNINQMDVSKLKNGIYMVRVNGNHAYKVIK